MPSGRHLKLPGSHRIRPIPRRQLPMHSRGQIHARQAAEGMPDHDIGSRDLGVLQQRMQLLGELRRHRVAADLARSSPCRPGHRCRPGWSSPLRVAQLPAQDVDQSPNPASITTVGLPFRCSGCAGDNRLHPPVDRAVDTPWHPQLLRSVVDVSHQCRTRITARLAPSQIKQPLPRRLEVGVVPI